MQGYLVPINNKRYYLEYNNNSCFQNYYLRILFGCNKLFDEIHNVPVKNKIILLRVKFKLIMIPIKMKLPYVFLFDHKSYKRFKQRQREVEEMERQR